MYRRDVGLLEIAVPSFDQRSDAQKSALLRVEETEMPFSVHLDQAASDSGGNCSCRKVPALADINKRICVSVKKDLVWTNGRQPWKNAALFIKTRILIYFCSHPTGDRSVVEPRL